MMALLAMLFIQLKITPMFWVYILVLVLLIALLVMRRKARKAKN